MGFLWISVQVSWDFYGFLSNFHGHEIKKTIENMCIVLQRKEEKIEKMMIS